MINHDYKNKDKKILGNMGRFFVCVEALLQCQKVHCPLLFYVLPSYYYFFLLCCKVECKHVIGHYFILALYKDQTNFSLNVV